MTKKKKILIIVGAVAVIAWFIICNTWLKGYTGTYGINDEYEWTQIKYTVQEGDEDKFTAELVDPDTIKVHYEGKYELVALLKLKDDAGRSMTYELNLYEEINNATDNIEICSSLIPVENPPVY